MERVCTAPGCGNTTARGGRCAECSRKYERTIDRAGKGVYSRKKWKLTRRRKLLDQPLCKCGRLAEHVHHVNPLREGGDPWKLEGLEALCASCHSRETRREQLQRLR